MTKTLRFARALCCSALLVVAATSCSKTSEPVAKDEGQLVLPATRAPTAATPEPAVHYVGGETVTAHGLVESIESTPVEGSELKAVVLTISTDGTSGKRLHCKLTLGATAPGLPAGSPITITGKVDPKDTESLEDCAMLAK